MVGIFEKLSMKGLTLNIHKLIADEGRIVSYEGLLLYYICFFNFLSVIRIFKLICMNLKLVKFIWSLTSFFMFYFRKKKKRRKSVNRKNTLEAKKQHKYQAKYMRIIIVIIITE